jgi:cytochrome c oxidase assembly protein subunit 15
MQNFWLHRYAMLLSVCTLFLVVAGASVTSKQAGLSVPDWPLSYGQVMPPMTGGVLFEHGHRMAGTTVGLLTIGLLVWILIAEKRSWMRKLGWVALTWVCVVGLLGGLTVKLLTPPPVSVLHTCLAQLFFSLTVAICVFTSKSWIDGPEMADDHGWPSMRSLAILLPLVVLTQVALGAGFRHGALSVMPHLVGAMVVTLLLLIMGAFVLQQFPTHRTLRPAAITLMSIGFVQVALGLLALVARMTTDREATQTIIVTVAHVAVGAMTLAASISLSILIRRNVRPRQEQTAESAAVTS